ncbi:MAG TPA: triose-phosphate isomerase [Acidiphilium sp.]|nr:MAG: triose-phosphate isomerase [Acidiphilium sp. 21-60-14]OYV89831.1 MAG: triose-phosphate isomerase [Acidiphilium sp. 37-60-79]OZB38475.1 MAG: triose-phosphate isomerase [Acidiphilium sp. 34-60-192]HQT88267.1 triose-phosphate isomerase [Acidiphilium sp.]HQU24677.1 triose-phosphate isomerase [Acidiphilium sp.]
MRQLIAGNWKMNGSYGALAAYAGDLKAGLARLGAVDLLVCPPDPLVRPLIEALGGAGGSVAGDDVKVAVGAQDCGEKRAGAHTGDVSADLLAELGARFVILGHSERRLDHHETNAMVRAKAEAAAGAGLIPIICVGESRAERAQDEAVTVVRAQLAGSLPDGFAGVVAYEPIWAIGTGTVPSLEQIMQIHEAIRAALVKQLGDAGATMHILYGGSVKPDNAQAILALPEVGGALVGGASLKAEDFLAIAAAATGG